MIRTLYKLLPKRVRRFRYDAKFNIACLWWMIADACFDTLRFAKFSGSFRKSDPSRDNLKAWLTFYYHRIEKGLALPAPRKRFGASWIVPGFLPMLERYGSRYGVDGVVGSCRKTLEAYLEFHADPDDEFLPIADAVNRTLASIAGTESGVGGGTRSIEADSIKAEWAKDFGRLARARHSVRNFSAELVDKSLVEQAVSIARHAPSVCNRQAWHVYALTSKERIRQALKYQNGNDGFSAIPCLLLVTGDVSAMLWYYERNQIWIDGGLFSMSLVYALHSLGLGTCCLNLCLPYTVEKQLSSFYGMRPSERAVMMIAVGHLPGKLKVAYSQRKDCAEVLSWAD